MLDQFFVQKWVYSAPKQDCFTVLLTTKGTSIRDVSSEGEGGGYEKLQIGETFKA